MPGAEVPGVLCDVLEGVPNRLDVPLPAAELKLKGDAICVSWNAVYGGWTYSRLGDELLALVSFHVPQQRNLAKVQTSQVDGRVCTLSFSEPMRFT